MSKTYGQFCGLARALDHVGDRWTLLVIRELLLGPAGYGDLLAVLEGVPTNLLANRLRQLEDDGLITRVRDPDDRRRATYQLTELGRGLEPALLALIRWGGNWMRTGPGTDRFDDRWLVLALRALLGDRPGREAGAVEVRFGDQRLVVSSRGDGVQVEPGAASQPDAVVTARPDVVLGLVSGELSMAEAQRRDLQITGDAVVAERLLRG